MFYLVCRETEWDVGMLLLKILHNQSRQSTLPNPQNTHTYTHFACLSFSFLSWLHSFVNHLQSQDFCKQANITLRKSSSLRLYETVFLRSGTEAELGFNHFRSVLMPNCSAELPPQSQIIELNHKVLPSATRIETVKNCWYDTSNYSLEAMSVNNCPFLKKK